MSIKFIQFCSFIALIYLGSCSYTEATVGSVSSGVVKSVGGVEKDNIKYVDTDPIPGNSGIIEASYPGGNIIRLNWTYASDAETPVSQLEYRVYSDVAFHMLSGVGNMETWAVGLDNYVANINSKDVSGGLLPGTDYYFNVIVKDGKGNKKNYVYCHAILPINQAPNPGNSGLIVSTDQTTSSVTLNWTAATDDITLQAGLEYQVYYSMSNNISTVSACEANGNPFGAYAANITTKEVTGLTAGTLYYFNVLVKDEAGLKSAYHNTWNTTDTDDPPIPGNSGEITSSFTGTSIVNLSWTYANDDITSQPSLQYLVYYSASDDISTVSQCESNGSPVGSFTANINSKSVNGLTFGTTWYFNVVVKDGAENKASYLMADFTTLTNDDPPVAGNSGLINVGTITSSSVILSWTKATDVESLQQNIQYLVYRSTSDNISTVADCESNGTPFGSFVKDITTRTVTGLNPSTKYYFNLVVKDEGDNKICYQLTDATTLLGIGSYHEGGIVFYLDGSGGGMVCALNDQSTSAQWGCYGTALTGCSGTSIGSGKNNTTNIIAGCAESGIAARICDNYSDGSYTDWFLPSQGEINAIKANKTTVDAALVANGGTAIDVSGVNDYWTSSQKPASMNMIPIPPTPTGDDKNKAYTWKSENNKNTTLRVRAVRTF